MVGSVNGSASSIMPFSAILFCLGTCTYVHDSLCLEAALTTARVMAISYEMTRDFVGAGQESKSLSIEYNHTR
jgi:hypothetical protein